MERDFLGISAKDSGGPAKDDSRGARQDSGGLAVQWPFSNRISALQHLMSFKAASEENPKKAAFDSLSSSWLQPMAAKSGFDTSYRASSVKEAPQRCFSLDRQGAHQFPVHPFEPQSTDTFGPTNHRVIPHQSIPVPMSSPFFKVHGSSNQSVTSLKQQPVGGFAVNSPTIVGSSSGPFVPRNVSKPTALSQLTIFYGGSVNVYDDVPLDKAQAIMLLASKASSSTSNAPNQRPELPLSSLITKAAGVTVLNTNHSPVQMQTEIHMQTQVQTQNPATSVASHIGAQSRSSSSTADEVVASKHVEPLPHTLSQHEPSKVTNTSTSILPRAIPQARKASLTRFLEKRKERVTNAMPYSCAKKPLEDSNGFKGANTPSNCSSPDLSLSSNREESWGSVQPKNAADSRNSPSTKLAM